MEMKEGNIRRKKMKKIMEKIKMEKRKRKNETKTNYMTKKWRRGELSNISNVGKHRMAKYYILSSYLVQTNLLIGFSSSSAKANNKKISR